MDDIGPVPAAVDDRPWTAARRPQVARRHAAGRRRGGRIAAWSRLSKGGNAVVSAPRVRAVLAWDAAPGSPDLDVTALLLRGDGRVASDDDMVFYNQPSHPGGAVRHAGKQPQGPRVQDVVEVDLTSLARATPEVERVVLVASVDGGTFARVRGLSLQARRRRRRAWCGSTYPPPRPRRRWWSASSTGAPATGGCGRSGRATTTASRAWRATSA
ncbi:hypothetical protein GCM10025868_36360 [Angustibacter aerolatus]|uniref:TerD domain-containing protein n=1 Tax=Angustibacter aerolatus TaxID=1162965 RepID=A0ABQ6JNY6_9ACTN|nr:TerD family protein [Angustibacter aerolatus]GMA88386.1 hypothetical protein GCM10025868_36360 [Angustibacter aerolatus]